MLPGTGLKWHLIFVRLDRNTGRDGVGERGESEGMDCVERRNA